MIERSVRVYCAGPLFNRKEREEMAELAECLEASGYETFLPQRDGIELVPCVAALVEAGMTKAKASEALSKAIFALDVYQVLVECEATVVNLNGTVPDEGAVSEAAIASFHRATLNDRNKFQYGLALAAALAAGGHTEERPAGGHRQGRVEDSALQPALPGRPRPGQVIGLHPYWRRSLRPLRM